MTFPGRLETTVAKKDSVILCWLGQAGFLLKTAKGKIILIDPYLSDYVNRVLEKEHGQGFRRMSAPLFDPSDLKVDILLASHEHEDHFDIDAIPDFLSNRNFRAYANEASFSLLGRNNIPTDKFTVIKKCDNIQFDEFNLSVVDCDHGDAAPQAMGFILDFGFTTIYYSGDTSYNLERLKDIVKLSPDFALLPINGAFGNLNAIEAAQYAADLKAKSCIPHHFWTFPLHDTPLGTPAAALDAFPKYAPQCKLFLAMPGDLLSIGSGGSIAD